MKTLIYILSNAGIVLAILATLIHIYLYFRHPEIRKAIKDRQRSADEMKTAAFCRNFFNE